MEQKPISILPHCLVAVGFLVIAGLSAWQTTEIPDSVLQSAVGPKLGPWIVTAFLAICGIGLVIAAFRGGWAHDQEGTLTEWGAFGYVVAGLLANVLLIDQIGFILASTLMFTLIARGYGSRQPLRDAGIGFALAVVSYVGFDRILGYKIGSGLIEQFI